MKYYVRLARYTLEKDLLLDITDDFGLVIPSNLLFYYEKSFASYLNRIRRTYFIDPMTYFFTIPENMLKKSNGKLELDSNNRYKLKKSYEKLINCYDSNLIDQFIEQIPISPSYFEEGDTINTFAKNNIEYQETIFGKPREKISRYEQMIGESNGSEDIPRPEFYVAPYFYANDFDDRWYRINIELLKASKKYSSNDIYSVICMNKNILNFTNSAERIAHDYESSTGFLLYLSDLNIETDSVSLFIKYKEFIRNLFHLTGKPIITLFSAGLSPYLSYFGLSGVSSGLCILERRDATRKYGFAISRIKFYLPSSHEKITEENFRTYLRTYDALDECDCSFCTNISRLYNRMSQTELRSHIDELLRISRGDVMKDTMKHFIINRLKEINQINTNDLDSMMLQLNTNLEQANKYKFTLGTRNIAEKILRILSVS